MSGYIKGVKLSLIVLGVLLFLMPLGCSPKNERYNNQRNRNVEKPLGVLAHIVEKHSVLISRICPSLVEANVLRNYDIIAI